MQAIFASASVSISELKKNPNAVIGASGGAPVAVLVHNKPIAYLVPAAAFQQMMEQLEDAELAALVRSRDKERSVKVTGTKGFLPMPKKPLSVNAMNKTVQRRAAKEALNMPPARRKPGSSALRK